MEPKHNEMAGLKILILTICMAVTLPECLFGNKVQVTDTTDFVLVKKSCGVELYEKWNATGPDQLAREVKSTFTVHTDMNSAAALIKDEMKGMQWNKNTSAYKVADDHGDHWICYIQYDLPWPVNNQDCVLQYDQHFSPDTVTITFKSTDHSLFPIQHRITRINDVCGKWIFTRIHNGIKVEYFITTTPSKTLPRWVTDPVIRNNLMDTMIAFRNVLEKKNN